MVATRTAVGQHLVTCTTKSNRYDHEVISHLGGPDGYWTKAQVVAAIESGAHEFYTNDRGRRAKLKVVKGKSGKFVQSFSDGVPNNNLLNLPDC